MSRWWPASQDGIGPHSVGPPRCPPSGAVQREDGARDRMSRAGSGRGGQVVRGTNGVEVTRNFGGETDGKTDLSWPGGGPARKIAGRENGPSNTPFRAAPHTGKYMART